VVIQAPANSGSMFFNYKKLIALFYWLCATVIMNLVWLTSGDQGDKVMEEYLLIVTLGKSSLMICVTFLIHLD
jgi:hypothetical protein